MKRQLAWLLLLSLFSSPALAAGDAGGMSGGFLRLGSSARGIGMGNAMVGLADDMSAAHFNPAAWARLRNAEFGMMGAQLLGESQLQYFGVGLPTRSHGSFALSALHLGSGGFERTDLYGNESGEFGEGASSFALSWGRRFGRLSLGATGRSVHHRIDDLGATGFGGDLGAHWQSSSRLAFGLALQNALAPSLTLDQRQEVYPRSFRAGASFRLPTKGALLSLEVDRTGEAGTRIRGGVEWAATPAFRLRGGLDPGLQQNALGASWQHQSLRLDYAWLAHELEASHVISLRWQLGGPFGLKVKGGDQPLRAGARGKGLAFDFDSNLRQEVEEWEIALRDRRGEVVLRAGGRGPHPSEWNWNGSDSLGRAVSAGNYEMELVVIDEGGERWSETRSIEVREAVGSRGITKTTRSRGEDRR